MTLKRGCTIEQAQKVLDLYDVRKRGGYKNQIITARNIVKRNTGMNVRELRKWLAEHA